MNTNDFDDDEDEKKGFMAAHGAKLIAGGVLVLVAFFGFKMVKGAGSGSVKPPEKIVFIPIAPLPPPPPPPPPPKIPPPEVPQEKKMVDNTPQEQAKAAEPEKPPDEPAPIGSNIKGDGNDGFGLHGSGGMGLGNGNGKGGGGRGSKYAGYFKTVSSRIQQAIEANHKTRMLSGHISIRVWPDPSGKITRVQLSESTGDPAMDAALKDEVLTGLRLDPPPEGMPTPVILKTSGRRP
jgi:outer membrane biosynthesis protein TonB